MSIQTHAVLWIDGLVRSSSVDVLAAGLPVDVTPRVDHRRGAYERIGSHTSRGPSTAWRRAWRSRPPEQLRDADPRVAAPSTCPPGGSKRSTPATPRSVDALARRARLRRLVHRVRRGRVRHPHVARGVRRRPVARAGQARPVNEVINQYRVPRPWNILGIGMGGPTVIAWGTEEQKQQFLRGIATNEEIWCQLFSEPGAGSDVAGLGDARGARRRRVDRERPEGLDVARAPRPATGCCSPAPIPTCRSTRASATSSSTCTRRASRCGRCVQITGDAEFNEVFFDDARIPDAWRLGPVGEGWRVAHHHADERAGVAVGCPGRSSGDAIGGSPVQRVIDRHRAGRRLRTCASGSARHGSTTGSSRSTTSAPPTGVGAAREVGPEGSITKLQQAEYNQRLQKLAVDLEGAERHRVGGPGPHRRRRRSASSAARADDPRTVARGFLRVAGQHHRGRHVGHHAQHPR